MKRIYIWGTGVILARIYENWIEKENVVAFIDNKPVSREYLGKRVILPEEIDELYDAIIVANMHSKEIREQCKKLGIDLDKVIFLYNNIETNDFNKDYKFIERIVGSNYSEIIKNRYKLVREISLSEKRGYNKALQNMPLYYDDYIRVKTLELISIQIEEESICGAVAELGVFKGEFSRCINCVFPQRKFYLFDTFEGFDKQEAQKEKETGTCNEAFIEAFKNTNVTNVVSKLEHPENAIVRKGLFPDSSEGLEKEEYAFVSLDVDFEESTYSGLSYFYPRLAKGGYIMIHDYNYGYFDAVKNAVRKYERDTGILLRKLPIADAIGTLVVVK